jgi:hypothetical protein
VATGNQKDTSIFKKTKSQIAFIKTLLSQTNNEK